MAGCITIHAIHEARLTVEGYLTARHQDMQIDVGPR